MDLAWPRLGPLESSGIQHQEGKERATYVKKRPGNNGHACMRVLLLCACPLQKTGRDCEDQDETSEQGKTSIVGNGSEWPVLHTTYVYPPPPACPGLRFCLLVICRPPVLRPQSVVLQNRPRPVRGQIDGARPRVDVHTHTCAARTESGHARPAQGVRQFRENQDGLSM
jgi:hypothetical protein